MAATRLIAMHKNKGKSIQQCLKDRTDYAQNGEKTNGGELVSSYACDPKIVEEQFAVSKREYLQKTGRVYAGDILAYQIRQAFKPAKTNKVLVEGVNIVKKHQKPTQQNQNGSIVEKEAPIDASNVMLLDPKENKPTRVSIKIDENGNKIRVSKKSGYEFK